MDLHVAEEDDGELWLGGNQASVDLVVMGAVTGRREPGYGQVVFVFDINQLTRRFSSVLVYNPEEAPRHQLPQTLR